MIDLLGKILTNILTALYEPFGFSLLLSFLTMFFYLYAYESSSAGKGWKNAIVTWYQKFKESVFFRKLFLLAFVTSMILFRTLLNRNLWLNPLSNVMGGWGIWEIENGEQKLTTECIENVIMMVPFTSMVMWTFYEKVGSGWKKLLWQSGKIAFIFSVSIEMLQLLLRLGTFQLSDLFYNTVGGINPYLPLDKVNRVNNLISVHKKCYMAINTPGMDISDYEKQVQKKILSYREKLVVSHTRNN